MSGETPPPSSTVAALDLGSNSFHLLVAELRAGEPHVVDRIKEMARQAKTGEMVDEWLEEIRDKVYVDIRLFDE